MRRTSVTTWPPVGFPFWRSSKVMEPPEKTARGLLTGMNSTPSSPAISRSKPFRFFAAEMVGTLKAANAVLAIRTVDELRPIPLLQASHLPSYRLIKAFIVRDERSEVKTFGSLGANLFFVFTEIDDAIRQRNLFSPRIDHRERGIFSIPLAGDTVAFVFVGVIALNERDGRGLSFFNDRRSDLDPAIMS